MSARTPAMRPLPLFFGMLGGAISVRSSIGFAAYLFAAGVVLLTCVARAGSTSIPDRQTIRPQGIAAGQSARRSSDAGTDLSLAAIAATRPQAPHVTDVAIQPSTRKKRLDLAIEVTGHLDVGAVEVTARLL